MSVLPGGHGVYGTTAGEDATCEVLHFFAGVWLISLFSFSSCLIAAFSAAAAAREAWLTGRCIPRDGRDRLFLLVLYGIVVVMPSFCDFVQPLVMSEACERRAC